MPDAARVIEPDPISGFMRVPVSIGATELAFLVWPLARVRDMGPEQQAGLMNVLGMPRTYVLMWECHSINEASRTMSALPSEFVLAGTFGSVDHTPMVIAVVYGRITARDESTFMFTPAQAHRSSTFRLPGEPYVLAWSTPQDIAERELMRAALDVLPTIVNRQPLTFDPQTGQMQLPAMPGFPDIAIHAWPGYSLLIQTPIALHGMGNLVVCWQEDTWAELESNLRELAAEETAASTRRVNGMPSAAVLAQGRLYHHGPPGHIALIMGVDEGSLVGLPLGVALLSIPESPSLWPAPDRLLGHILSHATRIMAACEVFRHRLVALAQS